MLPGMPVAVQSDDPCGPAYICHDGHAHAGRTVGNRIEDAGT